MEQFHAYYIVNMSELLATHMNNSRATQAEKTLLTSDDGREFLHGDRVSKYMLLNKLWPHKT